MAFLAICEFDGKFRLFDNYEGEFAREWAEEHEKKGKGRRHNVIVIRVPQDRVDVWRVLRDKTKRYFYKWYPKYFMMKARAQKVKDRRDLLDKAIQYIKIGRPMIAKEAETEEWRRLRDELRAMSDEEAMRKHSQFRKKKKELIEEFKERSIAAKRYLEKIPSLSEILRKAR